MSRIHRYSLAALAILLLLPACSKKEEGCKLDAECQNGQICRNMKCVADDAKADTKAEDVKADDAKADDAKTEDANKDGENADAPKNDDATTLGLDDAFFEKTYKLTDRGLDIDYTLDHCIYVNDNHTLEIDPGVTIMMASSGSCIDVRENGTLKINGTADKPVVFKTPEGASWDGIKVWSKNKSNVISYAQISNIGNEDHAIGMAGEARLAMDHVTIDGCDGNGVYLDSDARFVKFINNTIKNCKKYPLFLRNMLNIENFGDGNVFENNKKQYIDIADEWFNAQEDFTIPKLPLPYYMERGLGIESDSSTVTIAAGVELLFNHERSFEVRNGVLLKIAGTPEAPVMMSGINDEEVFWRGMSIESTRPSEIANLVIKNTGFDEAASLRLRGESKVKLANIAFKANPKTCFVIDSGVKLTNGGGLSFEGCGESNIYDERIEGEDEQRKVAALPDPVVGENAPADAAPAAAAPAAE